MIRAVLFDLDNTLTDFMKMKEEAILAGITGMIEMGLPMGIEEARERIYDIYEREGIEYQNVFDLFLQENLGEVRPELLAAGIHHYRRVRDDHLVLYPHVNLTLMSLLRRGLRLAVISDAPAVQAWQRIHHLKLQHVFETVVTFDTTGERKPSPVPFQQALQSLDLHPDEVLMVGDWPERDVVGASRLGIRTVFARYGNTKGIGESGADYEIDDIIELLDIIERINASETEGSAGGD